MLEFILKYWLETLFALIATVLGIVCKRIYKLYNNEKNHQKTKEQTEFYKGLQDLIIQGDKNLQDQVDIIKNGILSIQGKNFKDECRRLLDPDHTITLEEFEELQLDHRIYNSLGGNHDGDTLYKMVTEKATHLIAAI